ncbi:MAG: hypothetical protein WB508_07820 [Aeromicrobium sp.]|uniref:CoxG family protein n=1 Tax=Aeromicrobium sp. TaxID=1871063 RepID=UPI003C673424
MTWFTSSRESEAVLAAERSAIWEILTDPDAIVRLTPFLESIDATDDTWVWHLGGIDVLGIEISPSFTEKMTYDEGRQIDFNHAPPQGADEKAGAEGRYTLTDTDDGTHLAISLEVSVDLPLPKFSSPAVSTTMKTVIASMGNGFAKRLEKELGL